MVAIQYRMSGGIPGDVNRMHPASIEPCLVNLTNPPTAFGQALKADGAGGVQVLQAGDTALTHIYGIAVRPYPISPQTATNYGAQSIGNAVPPTNQPLDVMRTGYITVGVPAGQTPVKGGAVFVWVAANSGAHVQGGFEASASGGNTCALGAQYTFNGGADANGNVEVCIAP